MKFWVNSIFFSLMVACLQAQTLVDGIAAEVGKARIYFSDVALAAVEGKRGKAPTQEDFAAARERLVARKLVLQKYESLPQKLPEWVFDQRVEELINDNFEGNRQKLLETLKENGMSYEAWRATIEEGMIIGVMRRQFVEDAVRVTPAEIRQEYAAHAADFKLKGPVKVAINGESWGYVNPADEFHAKIVNAIASLKVGETSEPIDIDGETFVIKKEDEQSNCILPLEKAWSQIEKQLRAEKSKERFEAWIDDLKTKTTVKYYDISR